MAKRPTLLVMAKEPRLGQGKTRLAADVGLVEALRINKAMQARTLREACAGPWRVVLAAAPDAAVHARRPGLWPGSVLRTAQGAGDLGMRLTTAFARVNEGPAAVIGVDCPGATRRAIAAAFAALRQFPFALGPAEDGGFWILAARNPRALKGAFDGVRWSSEHAGADMAARLPGRAALLQTLRDVDTLEDWKATRARAGPQSSG